MTASFLEEEHRPGTQEIWASALMQARGQTAGEVYPIPLYRWGYESKGKLRDMPKVTQLGKGEAGIHM
jgi:hypothetical protein